MLCLSRCVTRVTRDSLVHVCLIAIQWESTGAASTIRGMRGGKLGAKTPEAIADADAAGSPATTPRGASNNDTPRSAPGMWRC
jgi:hypothetical protein